MTPDRALLLDALGAVIALIVLIARFRWHPFIVLITVSLTLGAVTGLPLAATVKSFQDGVGSALGFIAVVVGLGTMLGKVMAESGGAERIASTLIARFGERQIHWAMMCVAFIVGIPVFFQVGFVLLMPLVFSVAKRTGVSQLKIALSLLAGLSVVHGLVPPHPAAMLAVSAYKADIGLTILYALLIGLPTAALAGPLYAGWIAKRVASRPNPMAEQLQGHARERLPGFGITLFTVLIPVLLMLVASAADVLLDANDAWRRACDFVGNPIVALLIALLASFVTLGRAAGFTREQLQHYTNDCLAPTATIILIIGAGGGFNRVLIDSGVGRAIANLASGAHASPILMAWGVAALMRIATGSATVAMTTAAGIVAPIAAALPGSHPELLVLATGAGALILSHVNDSGFWLVKEFLNLTVAETLRTWTVTSTIIGVAGLLFTLGLGLLV
jgi:GntP family gluconate:H+ symporter